MLRAEDLAEERVIELVNPRPRDAYEGKLYWEEGYCDLHIPGEGTRRWEEGGEG